MFGYLFLVVIFEASFTVQKVEFNASLFFMLCFRPHCGIIFECVDYYFSISRYTNHIKS